MKSLKYKLAVMLGVVLVFSAVITPQMNQNDDVYGDADLGMSINL